MHFWKHNINSNNYFHLVLNRSQLYQGRYIIYYRTPHIVLEQIVGYQQIRLSMSLPHPTPPYIKLCLHINENIRYYLHVRVYIFRNLNFHNTKLRWYCHHYNITILLLQMFCVHVTSPPNTPDYSSPGLSGFTLDYTAVAWQHHVNLTLPGHTFTLFGFPQCPRCLECDICFVMLID